MRFQKYAISLSLQAHRSIRVHTTVLMRFRMSTCVKTIELQVVTEAMRIQQTHAPLPAPAIFFMRFRLFPVCCKRS